MGKGGHGLGGRIGGHWGWDWLGRCVSYSSRKEDTADDSGRRRHGEVSSGRERC